MATLDLGKLGFEIGVETTGLDKGLADAKRKVEGLGKSLDQTGKKKIKPVVDASDVTKLDAALGKTAKNAERLASKRVSPVSDTRGVEKLSAELSKADKAAESISLPSGFEPALGGAASKARELAEALSKATSGGGQFGAVAGAVKGLLPQLTAATVTTAAFTKGWKRLSDIEGATATLTGLGNSAADVASIMSDANKSVKGTAYGLGEAVKTASTAVAAGVKPGQDLERVLTTVADTAAITGDNMGDMGAIFNSVLSQGALKGDDLMQLQSRGLPVLQLVADQLGVTAAEAADMASKGEISFQIFEEALRNRVGGAAQDAGSTVKGSLANVGAAVGRLGAMVEGPLFKLLPAGLGAVTTGIDMVGKVAAPVFDGLGKGIDIAAEGATALGDAWGKLPAPIKTITVSIGAARVAMALLNTEMGKTAVGKVTASLATAKTSFMAFRTEVGMTAAQLRATNPNMTAFGANLRAVATNAGVATGAMGLLKGTASGLLGLVGGPAGLAVMGLGAAIGGLISIFQKHRQAAQEAQDAIQSWADTLEHSGGRVDETVQQQALAATQARELGEEFRKAGISSAEFANAITSETAYKELIADLDAQREAIGGVTNAERHARTEKYQTAQAISETRKALEEERERYVEGADAAMEATKATEELAAMTRKGGDAADETAPKYAELEGVFGGVRDEAKSVDDAISELANRMNMLSEDPAIRLQAYVDDMHSAMIDLGKTITTDLPELNLDTGVWEQGTEATIKANAEMRDFAQTLNETAAAQYELNREQGMGHVDAANAARDSVRGFATELRESLEATGRSKEEIDKLVETYASVPDEVFTELSVAGAETADELVSNLKLNLAQLNEDATVLKVEKSALDMTAEEAEKLGFTLSEIEGTRFVELKANSESAQAALTDIEKRGDKLGLGVDFDVRVNTEHAASELSKLDKITASYSTDPAHLGVVADTQEARTALDAMKIEYAKIDGKLYIQHNTDEVQAALNEVGSRVDGLPGGYITIKDDTDKAQQKLDTLGIKTKELPNGELLVTSNAEDVQRELDNLTRWTEAFGDEKHVLEFLADTTEFEGSAQQIADTLNELDKSGATPVTGMDIQEFLERDGDVRRGLLELSEQRGIPLADLNPEDFNEKNKQVHADMASLDKLQATTKVKADDREARSTINQFKRWALERVATPITAVVRAVRGNYDGGVVGYEQGGVIPALAGGGSPMYGTHGQSYILPTSGPGTDTVDGILGVGRNGEPTAAVNRGEFVVNDRRTAQFEPTLWAINRGDALGAMRTLAAHLPGMDVGALPALADGGVVSAAELLAFAGGQRVNGQQAARSLQDAPYVFGGSNWGDCSSSQGQLALFATGNPATNGRYMATMDAQQKLSAIGFSNGLGSGARFAIGWFNGGPWGGHTSGTIYDENGNRTNVEMGGGAGGQGKIGGAAAGADHPQYTDHAYIPLAGGTGVMNGDIESTSVDGMTVTQGGKSRSIDWGTASHLAGEVKDNMHRMQQLARFNAGVYDTGGYVDGQTAVLNMSKSREYMLNGSDTIGLEKVAPALIRLGEAAPAMTRAINDFTTLGNKLVATGGNRAAITQVGWEQTRQAKTDLQNMPDGAPEFEKWAVYANRTAGEALMGAATMSNNQWIDAGEKLGLSFLGEYAGGIVSAQEKIEDSYVTQVDASDALIEAQLNLAEAQRELNEAMDGAPELSKNMARKIEDAEAKVAEARKGGDAKKIADAEKKLARVREDASDELEKNGAKDAQAILQAREAVTQAEGDLTTAQGVVKAAAAATGQAHIAMALEVASTVIKVAKKIADVVRKLIEMERAARVGAAESHAVVMANMRDLTAAVETQRNVVGALLADMVQMKVQVLNSTWQVRVAQDDVWQAHLEGLVGIRRAEAALQDERDKLTGKQMYNFVGLDTEYDRLIGNVHAGIAGVDGAHADLLDTSTETMLARIRGEEAVADAANTGALARVDGEGNLVATYGALMAERLQATKGLTDREAELVKDVFDGKFADYDAEHASIEENRDFADAYYAMQKAGMQEVMEKATKTSAERLALESLVDAARWEREKNILTMQIASLDATREQQEAVKKLTRLGRDFNKEIAAYNKMVSGTMGMQSDEALIKAEIARLEAENAQARKTIKDTRVAAAFDADGDGRILGIQSKKSLQNQAARATLQANNDLIKELKDRLAQVSKGPVQELTAADRKKIEKAGMLRAAGETEAADQLLRTTTYGRAQDVKALNDIDAKLKDIKDERTATADRLQDAADEYRHGMQRLPLTMQEHAAGLMQSSYEWQAEGYRDKDTATRRQIDELVDFQRARAFQGFDLSHRNPRGLMMGLQMSNQKPKTPQTTIRMDYTEGSLILADDMVQTFKRLEKQLDGVKIDVRALKKAGAPTGKSVQLVRAGIK